MKIASRLHFGQTIRKFNNQMHSDRNSAALHSRRFVGYENRTWYADYQPMTDQSKSKHIEGHPAQIVGSVNVGDTATFVAVDDATDIYFGAAFSTLARLNYSSELHSHFRNSRILEDVLTTCVLSFFSLEAAINRLFHETFISNLRQIKESIPLRHVQHLRRSWNNNLSVKDKYLLLPPLVSDFEFDPGTSPYQLFDEFVQFRNSLVHSKAKTQKTTVRITSVESSSTGGEVLDHNVEAPTPEELFPQTNFATTFAGLTQSDAEKAFEIMYRMRLALFAGTMCAPPHLLADLDNSPYMLGDTITTEVKKLFSPRFGDFDKFPKPNDI